MTNLNLNFDSDNEAVKTEDLNKSIPGVAPDPQPKRAVVPGETADQGEQERVFFQNKTANKILIGVGAAIAIFVIAGIVATLL